LAKSEQTELTPEAEERITRIVRSLGDDRVDRGVDLSRPMHCSSCDEEKSPLGATQYGIYQLCNDCLLDFTLALARGDIENVAQYMTKRPDVEPGSEPPQSPSAAPTRSGTMPQFTRSDKLVPRNEPC
jgi:hypothetical protein